MGECRFQWVSEAAFAKEEFKSPESAECEPEAKAIPANDVPIGVTGKATGLTAGTTYDYRLLAKTEGGGEAQSDPLAFTAPAKPGILSTYAENLSSTSADLHAQIKPNGAATGYRFEYDTRPYVEGEGTHGTSIPVPDEGIGAGGPTGGATESVLQHAGPLSPGTTYYYRVVATNTQGVTTGAVCAGSRAPDCMFTTLPATVASERGYELVTPADKQGGSDMFAETTANGIIANNIDVGAPAEDGEGFLLRTQSGFGAFPFAAFDEYVFKRVENAQTGQLEWSYTSLASPSLGVQGNKAVPLSSEDLSRVAVDDGVGSLAGEEGVRVTSLIGSPGASNPPCEGAFSLEDAFSAGCYIDLHEDVPYHSSEEEIAAGEPTEFVGGSQNLEHVVLDSHSPGLCPGVKDAAAKVTYGAVLCEWSGGYETLEDGKVEPVLQLVNVAPGNEAQPASKCGAALGLEVELAGKGLAHGAVSQDGSRVLFTAPAPRAQTEDAGCWNGEKAEEHEGPKNAPQLYARVDTGEGAHEVFEVSAPEAAVQEAGHAAPVRYPAVYVGASSDGSKVFFLTKTWMTQKHPEGHDAELYEWEAEGSAGADGACAESSPNYVALSKGCLTRVSAGEAGMESEKDGARVQFVSAVSADAANVYFAAFDVLAPHGTRYPVVNKIEGGEHPVDLYRYDLETRRTSYVATIDTLDYSDETGCATNISVETGVESFTGLCDQANWYTTPDGQYLLFGASTKIEGYNAAANGCAERSLPSTQADVDGRCSELYRYSAPAAERGEQAIVCVSCGSGGADAAGNAEFARSALEGPDSGPPRGMSNNGEYVFFDSQASLVSGASNGTLDTYQWREDLATHERSISLVGSGTDTAPTFFLGYAPNPGAKTEQAREAGNVFIGTHAKLSPVQTNSVGNIYDARACEPESPCIEPPTGETAQCLGGECQPTTSPPLFQTPATNTLSSSGNITPEPPATVKPKALTTAQKLAAALKACKKDKNKTKHKTCEASARKKYKTTKARKSSKSKHGGKS